MRNSVNFYLLKILAKPLTPLYGINKQKDRMRKKIIFKNWHEKGIRVVFDVSGQNGEFYTFEKLKTMYNIKDTFLDYQYLLNKLPQSWITQINDNRIIIFENKN